jgi:DNA-binding MarR family transcriptional regulator
MGKPTEANAVEEDASLLPMPDRGRERFVGDDPLPPELEERLGAISDRIFAAWRELRRGAGVASLREVLYGSGDDALDPAQLDALELLIERGAWRMSELAAALYVDASTATRTIDRLVAGGLAVRRPATDDARGIVVSATSKGRKQCIRIQRGRRVLMREFLDEFTLDECEELGSLMQRLVLSVNHSADRH